MERHGERRFGVRGEEAAPEVARWAGSGWMEGWNERRGQPEAQPPSEGIRKIGREWPDGGEH